MRKYSQLVKTNKSPQDEVSYLYCSSVARALYDKLKGKIGVTYKMEDDIILVSIVNADFTFQLEIDKATSHFRLGDSNEQAIYVLAKFRNAVKSFTAGRFYRQKSDFS